MVKPHSAAAGGRFLTQQQGDLARNFLGDEGVRALQVWGGELLLSKDAQIMIHDSLNSPVIISRWALSGRAYYHRPAKLVRKHERRSFVISFCDRGLVNLIPSERSDTISDGYFTVTKYSNAYSATLLAEDGEIMVTRMAVIPDHLLLPELSHKAFLGRPVSSKEGLGLAAKQALDILLDHGKTLSNEMRDAATDLFLKLVAGTLNSRSGPHRLVSGRSKRFDEIFQYMSENAGNPNLNAATVARHFRISPRYLSNVLSSNGEVFPSLLRKLRVELSMKLLCGLESGSHNITEVATLSGFKSSSHFSRVFRALEGCSPKEYRSSLHNRE